MIVYMYSCLIGIVISIVLWIYKSLNYWKKRSIPFVPALPLVGNFKDAIFMKKSGCDIFHLLYNDEATRNSDYVGINVLTNPAVLLRSPDLIKQICISDYSVFNDRFAEGNDKVDKLGSHNMFMLNNPMWKKVRAKFSPFFSGKIKYVQLTIHIIEYLT